ncbi:MAG: hypothetical protein EPN17_14235 [Methylobacter sp.]|nr:MAG: hypothetical protein EPN17_14235 [Methylobacter sp.]
MKIRTIIMFLMLLNCLISPKVFAEEASENAFKISNDSKAVIAGNGFDQQGYYTFRPDLRKCLSPLCGGFFVKAVNQTLTRCANGSRQAECYVASLNNRKNFDINSAALLQGLIKPKIYGEFGNLGIFAVKAAFSSSTDTVGAGLFVGLENNGIVCITTPCFSADQYLLNRSKIRAISGIDLGKVGASDLLLNEALSIMAKGEVLIASGVNIQTEEVAGKGITFVADQFYLPIESNSQ